MNPLLGFFNAFENPVVLIILLGIAVLIWGKRLPEVGRSLGKGIVEFKKGLRGLEDEVQESVTRNDHPVVEAPRPPQRVTANVPKFEDATDSIPKPPPSPNA